MDRSKTDAVFAAWWRRRAARYVPFAVRRVVAVAVAAALVWLGSREYVAIFSGGPLYVGVLLAATWWLGVEFGRETEARTPWGARVGAPSTPEREVQR
ncbi:MAG: hypothetical protein HYT80_06230 [Euryarchaeota archaeon]|nr:hypothetical protein [Euryarchaeota archaeon]